MAIVTDERTSSSSTHQWSYDVFLSFRGEDCRDGFAGHLYTSLCEKGFITFADNDLLLEGENISIELLKAIELSQISIIVFSKNYAASPWCLNEVVKIIECKNTGQLVLPVFYEVNSSDICKLQGRFGEDLAKYEKRLKYDVETVQRWKAALSQAANLPGFHYNDREMESVVIKEIIESIQQKVQPAVYRPTMYPEEVQTAVYRPTLSPQEVQPAVHRRTLFSHEQQKARIYRENHVSVVGIFSGNPLELGGSGFIWDNMGHIVTNWHVIRGASDFKVRLFDGVFYDANVVGFYQHKDVAVLHAEELEGKVKRIRIGHSANLLVGQDVFAIGFPFGLCYTFTDGIVSALQREIKLAVIDQPIQDVIQINAAINYGNSGGPLFDSAGKLIGINTAFRSATGEFCGVAFSIAVDSVRGIIDKMVTFKKGRRPHLGIKLSSLRLPDGLDVLLVQDVAMNGPAANAGLQKIDIDAGKMGDYITSVNGKKVTNKNDLYVILNLCEVGDKVTVEVLRGEHKENITVTLEQNLDASESNDMPNSKAFKA